MGANRRSGLAAWVGSTPSMPKQPWHHALYEFVEATLQEGENRVPLAGLPQLNEIGQICVIQHDDKALLVQSRVPAPLDKERFVLERSTTQETELAAVRGETSRKLI